MITNRAADYALRAQIMNLLSDEETARVSSVEASARLAEGEEYIELNQLSAGVCRAHDNVPQTRDVLTKNAINYRAWNEIVALLPKPANDKTPAP